MTLSRILIATLCLAVALVAVSGCSSPSQGGKDVIPASVYKARQSRKDAHEDK